jgi:hypothetical protein
MDNMNRTFDAARQSQGFTSQAHLDAFFAAYDHNKNCEACRNLGSYALLSDGYQPTLGSCPIHQSLVRAYFSL